MIRSICFTRMASKRSSFGGLYWETNDGLGAARDQRLERDRAGFAIPSGVELEQDLVADLRAAVADQVDRKGALAPGRRRRVGRALQFGSIITAPERENRGSAGRNTASAVLNAAGGTLTLRAWASARRPFAPARGCIVFPSQARRRRPVADDGPDQRCATPLCARTASARPARAALA